MAENWDNDVLKNIESFQYLNYIDFRDMAKSMRHKLVNWIVKNCGLEYDYGWTGFESDYDHGDSDAVLFTELAYTDRNIKALAFLLVNKCYIDTNTVYNIIRGCHNNEHKIMLKTFLTYHEDAINIINEILDDNSSHSDDFKEAAKIIKSWEQYKLTDQ